MRDATDITIVLDRTGSMESIKTDVIGGFNTFVKDQQAAPGDCRLTLVQFDSQDPYEIVRDNVPIAEVKLLDEHTFVPRASTPLYDALGRAIVNTGERLKKLADNDRPDKVVFVIMTDGQENASKEYTRDKVFGMVKHQTDVYKWQFVYLGANQDAMAVGAGIGTPISQAADYGTTPDCIAAAYSNASANVRKYRGTGLARDLQFTDNQRKQMKTP